MHQAEATLHGSDGTTHFKNVSLLGLSIGGNKARGAAVELSRRQAAGFLFGTLTLQELPIGQRNLWQLFHDYVTSNKPDQPVHHATDGYKFVSDTLARNVMDRNGAEPQMRWRVVRAMTRFSMLNASTHPEKTRDELYEIADNGTGITVALVEDSNMTKNTPNYLPNSSDVHRISIKGAGDESTEHIVNENQPLVGMVAVRGVIPTPLE